ncbi:hypothetical protein D3C85_1164420 [compost metagenome]
MLQIVASFDGETLEAVALAAPVQNQLLQRRLDSRSVEQPAAQLFLTRLQLTGGLHLDQCAVGARLHPHARRGFSGVHRVVQRKPFHLGQGARFIAPRRFPGQGISLNFARRIEHTHIAQVGLPCIQLYVQGQLKAIPGPFARHRQRHLGGEVRRFFLGNRRQHYAHGNSAQPTQVQLLTQDDTPSDSGTGFSISGTASARLGGSGAK